MSTTVVLPRIQTPVATKTQPWRPGPFQGQPGELDRSQLDQVIKTTFDQIYTLQQNAAGTVTQGASIASGAVLVPAGGVLKAIATGLRTVSNVVVSVDAGTVATNLWVSATPSATVPGAFDIFVWQPTSSGNNTPTAATGATTIRWHAYGT
jgi:hypothetical protein